MADTLEFELVAPDRLLYSEPVEMVVVPGSEGDFGVLPGHSLVLTAVRPGTIDVYHEGTVSRRLFVEGGFAEATNERCTVLAEAALEVGEIDRSEAQQRLADAQAAEGAAGEDEAARQAATKELRIAEALLAAAGEAAGH